MKQTRLFEDDDYLEAHEKSAAVEFEEYPQRLRTKTIARFPSLRIAEQSLPKIVADKLGGNAHITSLRRKGTVMLVRVGILISFRYFDRGIPIIKYVDHPRVTTLRVAPEGNHFAVAFPSYLDFAKTAGAVTHTRHIALEAQLLESIHERLVSIPTVRTTLNPISNLLFDLMTKNQIPIGEFKASHGKPEQAERYIRFLESLGFLRREKDDLASGASLIQHLKARPAADERRIMSAMLSEVLERGQDQLKDYLKLTGLVPFLRIANSYYTPAHRLHRLIEVSPDQLNEFQSYIYHRHSDSLKWRGQIRQVSDADILHYESKEETIVGLKRIWDQFEHRVAAIEA